MISIPLVIVFAALAFLSIFSTSYLTVSDLEKYTSPTRVSVMGNVSAGSVRLGEGYVKFKLTDGKNEVNVIYYGALQLDNVTGYAKVTVDGIYYPEENLIKAENVLYKCPSKEEIEAYNASG